MSKLQLFVQEPIDIKIREILDIDKYIELSDATDCEYTMHSQILWANPNSKSILDHISKSHDTNSKIIVLIVDDYEERYKQYKNLILLRTSLKSSKKRNNEFVLPYLWECTRSPSTPIADKIKPIVGFCGQMTKHRKKLTQVFQQSNDLTSNFIIRDKFWGGIPHDPNLIYEYEENVKNSQFILCNRGAGNFSMRFYQTLAFGRIPVLVNTDMVLPFEEEIPWRDIIVFEKNEQRCLKKVLKIHSNGETEQRQKRCRELFDECFSPEIALSKLIFSFTYRKKQPWFKRLLNVITHGIKS